MHITNISDTKENREPRKLGGSWEGEVIMADNFDDQDDALIDSFYNSNVLPETSSHA